MKPSEQRIEERSAPPLANSFNISDGLADEHQTDETSPAFGRRSLTDDDDRRPSKKRSPSPSAISTASSGSPLIRSDSSSAGDGDMDGVNSLRRQHSAGPQQSGPLKRPAPTSIAAAQLRQQGLHHAHSENQESTRSHKHQNGNKLVHMAKFPAMNHQSNLEQVDYRLKTTVRSVGDRPQHREKPKKNKLDDTEESGKSFGYNLGKTLAYRANRFNEFWSVNKMRYMNLACLLMTLVCLFTILLFSKTTMTTTGNSTPIDASESGIQRHKQLATTTGSLDERLKHRHRILESNEQDRREDDDEQEAPVGSIDSIDRQPFVRTPSQRHSAGHGDDRKEAANHDDFPLVGGLRVVNSDGFNLFDERHDDSTEMSSSKRSLDDLLQDAQRQLRRQQESEQEMEEATSPSKVGQHDSTESGATAATNPSSRRPIQDPISQVLQDLDGFGLFKSIKSRLIDQLHQQNLTSKLPTIVRSKNGATIIMSFSNGAAQKNSSSSQNDTTSAEAVPSFLRDLLPPMMAGGAGSSLFDRRPSGFAAITINSEPTLSIRSSGLPIGGGVFGSSLGGPSMSPVPFSFGLPPFISAISNQRPPLMAGGGPSGFMSLIMQASNELANQMRRQLDLADNQTAQVSANGTTADSNSTNGIGKQEPQASQHVKVIQFLSGGLDERAPEVAKNDSRQTADNANSTTTSDSDEVETFDLSRLIGSPTTRQATFRLPLSPFHSIYSTARRSVAPIGGGSMVMIESSSGVPSSIVSGESSLSFAGGPLGSGSPSLLNEIGSSSGPPSLMPPFPFLPNVFLLGSQQRAHASHFPEPVNPMLRSILSSVVSDLSQSVLEEGGKAAGKAAQTGKPASAPHHVSSSRRDGSQEDNEWDELGSPYEGASKSRSRPRAIDSSDLMGDSSNEPTPGSQESSFRLPAPTRGSLFEQMFEQLNSAARPPTFGTIRQTIRGPNGVTVERVIGLPKSSLAGGFKVPHEHGEGGVQTVPAGVRSQSLSRMDTPMDNKLRSSSPFARLFSGGLEQDSSSSSGRPSSSSPMSFISQLLNHELASERPEDSHHDSVRPRVSRAHIGPLRPTRNSIMSERSDSDDLDPDDEPPFWPSLPRVRVASARIRLVSPRSDSDLAPLHFRMTAPSADQQDETVELPTTPQHHSRRLAVASPFTSPSSPLFGFPVMNRAHAPLSPPSGPQQQESDSANAPAESSERDEHASGPSGGSHRRQRSFVYHSNHEIAQDHARKLAASNQQQQARRSASEAVVQTAELRSASSHQPQQQTGPLLPAASVVMGRRLDDFVERRR